MESKNQLRYSDLHKSIEEIVEINSALIDRRILKRERNEGLKFVAGTFSIKWAVTKCSMTTELYFRDRLEHWWKEKIACFRPLDILPPKSSKRLEMQKGFTYEIIQP